MTSIAFSLSILITISIVFNFNLCLMNCDQKSITANNYYEKIEYKISSNIGDSLDCVTPYNIVNKEEFNAVDAYFGTPDGQVAHVPYIHKDQSLTLYVCTWDNSKCEVFSQYKIDKEKISDNVWIRPPPNSPYSEEQLSLLKLKCK